MRNVKKGRNVLRVKYERLRRGWSQTVLSYYTNVTSADISRIETGRLRPYPTQLRKLATVLDVPPEDLLKSVSAKDAATATAREPKRHTVAAASDDATLGADPAVAMVPPPPACPR